MAMRTLSKQIECGKIKLQCHNEHDEKHQQAAESNTLSRTILSNDQPLNGCSNSTFVHSYQFQPANGKKPLALTEHGGPITAVIGRDNIVGTQFHPEKSQATGLRLIANFLRWSP